ncbi:MAG: YitT family protein, partial [Bacilli bacterium]|nr:YitT family protein [Bacilli bacterium]
FSSGLIRKSRFSPGGFSVLFDLMNKYFHISIGNATIIVNSLLIIGSSFIFGLQSALYSVVSLLVSSYIVDRVIIGISDNKVFYIVTKRPLEVRDYIMDKLHYSVTIIKVRGGYSGKKKKMLMCIVPTIEYVKLKEIIKEIDNEAFFLIVDTYESSVKKRIVN